MTTATLKTKGIIWIGASLLMAGAAMMPAEAMPIASAAAAAPGASQTEQVAYLRRVYRDRFGRLIRVPRSRNLSPNYYCRSQPSRCR